METPNQSSDDVSKSPATDGPRTGTAVDSPMQPPAQLPKSPAFDGTRALSNRRRALSVSGAEGIVRDTSPLSTWLPTETRVRDFGNTPPASPSASKVSPAAPKVSSATMQRLASNKRLRVSKSLATSVLDSAGIPKNDSARQKVIHGKRPAIRKYTGLPPDLTPHYCGRHPIPYTMPDKKSLSKIFHPDLVDLILHSNYPQIAPNRCFCSLVLHELQMREPKYWLDIYGPPSHAELQFQLRTMLTRDERRVARILMHYGDALRVICHAKRKGRPMKYDTYAEYVSLLCEEVFTCGPHHLLADDYAPTENLTQVADKNLTEESQAPVKDSKNVTFRGRIGETAQGPTERTAQNSREEAVQGSVEIGRDPVEEIVQNPVEETLADTVDVTVRETVDDKLEETVRKLVRQTIREMIRETEGETGIEPNSERPAEATEGECKKGSLRKSLFKSMRKVTGLKKKVTAPSPEQR